MRSPIWYSSVGTRSRFGSKRLVLAQIHGHIRTVKAPHRAADDVADAILELGENQLLSRPGGCAASTPAWRFGRRCGRNRRGDFHLDLLAQLRVRLDPAGVENGNLVVLGEDLFGDHQLGEGPDVPGLRIDDDSAIPGPGPTAFLAADSSASWTAATRTSRLMPFSRSQNSKTAKNSAFIRR